MHTRSDESHLGIKNKPKNQKEDDEIWTPCWERWIVSASRNLPLAIYHIKIQPLQYTKLTY